LKNIYAYKGLANITFWMEELLVAGTVVWMIFIYCKLADRKVGINNSSQIEVC
jgi:hypothetical protein